MTADELMKKIKSLPNGERIKLLGYLFDEYFDNRPPKEEMERELEKDWWGEDEE